MPAIHVGDPAIVTLMGQRQPVRGHVESFAEGVADRDRTTSANLLPNVNPTFSWVRLAQRIPVRVVLDPVPSDVRLVVGQTATVDIRSNQPRLRRVRRQTQSESNPSQTDRHDHEQNSSTWRCAFRGRLLLTLNACTTVGPDYHVPAGAAINNPAAAGNFKEGNEPSYTPAPLPPHWWRLYQDPVLDGLIAKAFDANTDLRSPPQTWRARTPSESV